MTFLFLKWGMEDLGKWKEWTCQKLWWCHRPKPRQTRAQLENLILQWAMLCFHYKGNIFYHGAAHLQPPTSECITEFTVEDSKVLKEAVKHTTLRKVWKWGSYSHADFFNLSSISVLFLWLTRSYSLSFCFPLHSFWFKVTVAYFLNTEETSKKML